ncbi:MAG TPA: transcriptional repressor [Rickettsiales bacterium]|nr:transcriptional repressor [Rickettsiales bacterium]
MIPKKPIKGPNKLVQDVLSESGKPLGAYEILERVKVKGINGPPTVYRALDKLMKLGMVHRIASKHTYIICRHGSEHANESIIFAVCNRCDNVDEIPSEDLHHAFEGVRREKGFRIEHEIVEVTGLCGNCSEQKGAH